MKNLASYVLPEHMTSLKGAHTHVRINVISEIWVMRGIGSFPTCLIA